MIVHKNIWHWGRQVTIILAGGRALCHVSIENENKSRAWLSGVSVCEKSRHRGLGNELLQAAERNARKRGAELLCLWADPNDWPIEWYKRKGYALFSMDVSETGLIALSKRI